LYAQASQLSVVGVRSWIWAACRDRTKMIRRAEVVLSVMIGEEQG